MMEQDLKFSTEYSYRIKLLVLGAKCIYVTILFRIRQKLFDIYLQARHSSLT